MRTALLFSLVLGACSWTTFDDLSDTTWVHSTDDPGVGAADYAVRIAGVSSGTAGGTLAVLSDDSANLSTLAYDGNGGADVGPNPIKLGEDKIGTLSESPVFVTDGVDHVGLVERSVNGGNFALVYGPITSPSAIEFAAIANPAPVPDAAAFLSDSALLFAAGNTLYRVPPAGGTPAGCAMVDGGGAPIEVAALTAASSTVIGWAKDGTIVRWQESDLAVCPATALPAPAVLAFTTDLAPAPGARIDVRGSFAVLAGHSTSSRAGAVYVVDTTTGAQVGTTLAVEGLANALLADFNGDRFIAVGIPDAPVGEDKVAAGKVELYRYDVPTGALDATPETTLYDAQPDDGQQFGRDLTTMNFNGNVILVVAADSEVFAYYKTAIYDHLP